MKNDLKMLPLSAERVLRRGNDEVIVRMYGPEKVRDEDPEWCCQVTITGLDFEQPFELFGSDGFEVIGHALTVITDRLEPFRDELAWGCGPEGGIGFGHHITDAYGAELYRRLNHLVLEETTRYVQGPKARNNRLEQE